MDVNVILEIGKLEYLLYIHLRDIADNPYYHEWYDAKAIAVKNFMLELGFKWHEEEKCFL